MSKIFGFRLTENMRKYIDKQAHDNGMSTSKYVVMLIREDMKKKGCQDEEK